MNDQPHLTNGYDPEEARQFVGAIEDLEKEKESERGACGQRCAQLTRRQRDQYKAAKDAGFDTDAMRAQIRIRKKERQIAALKDDLEADSRQNLENLVAALGEFGATPLGQAAIVAAGGGATHHAAA